MKKRIIKLKKTDWWMVVFWIQLTLVIIGCLIPGAFEVVVVVVE